jgi:hypothetical protein
MKIELWQIAQAPHPASAALQGIGVSKLLLIKVPKGLSSFLKRKFVFLQPGAINAIRQLNLINRRKPLLTLVNLY